MLRLSLILIFFVSLTGFARTPDGGILFFGDWGKGTRDQKRVATGIGNYCRTDVCLFGILLGDNFYPDGVSSTKDSQWKEKWHDMYDYLGLRFYVSLGNHDWHGNTQAQIDYSKIDSKWMLPSHYYEFTFGDAAYFAIDSEKLDSTQLNWLNTRLAASKATWKVVYGHHPIFSSGGHGSSKELQRTLLPVLRKNKVDLYITGHDHHKEVIQREGITFLISGAAAENRGAFGGTGTKFKSGSLGFGHLKIQGSTARVRFMDGDGKVEWEGTLNKGTRRPVFP